MLPIRARDFAPPRGGQHGILNQMAVVLGRNMPFEYERPSKPFRIGFVLCRFRKLRKSLVRNRVFVYIKAVHHYFAHRAFSIGGKAVWMICSHQKLAASEFRRINGRTAADLSPAS